MKYKALLPLFALFLLAFLFAPGAARASDFRSGDAIIIAADEVIDDDLIITGDTITIDGTITGDLVASGRSVVVNGSVGGSAIIAAQVIEVAGQVAGSLYAGGYAVTLAEGAAVERNAYVAGFQLTTLSGSQVGRDVTVVAAQVLHNGAVDGDLNVAAGALEINGTAGGDVTGEVGGTGAASNRMFFPIPGLPPALDLTPGLVVGPEAQIGGEMLVTETTADEAAAAEAEAEAEQSFLGLPPWLVDRIGETIGLLLVALLLILLIPRFLPIFSDVLSSKPLPSLGWGALVYLILFPLALVVGLILVGLITLIFAVLTFGRYTAAILGLTGGFYIFALFAFLFFIYIVAWLIVGHTAGRALLSRAGVNPSGRATQFLYVLVGVVLFQVLRAIPILGLLLVFVVGALALGAIFVWWLDRRRAGKSAVVQPA